MVNFPRDNSPREAFEEVFRDKRRTHRVKHAGYSSIGPNDGAMEVRNSVGTPIAKLGHDGGIGGFLVRVGSSWVALRDVTDDLATINSTLSGHTSTLAAHASSISTQGSTLTSTRSELIAARGGSATLHDRLVGIFSYAQAVRNHQASLRQWLIDNGVGNSNPPAPPAAAL